MKPVSTRLTEEEIERIDQAREGGEKRSAAIRRLLRGALDNSDDDTDNDAIITPTTLILGFGAFTLGVAMEPVASSEFLVAVAGIAFIAAAAIRTAD